MFVLPNKQHECVVMPEDLQLEYQNWYCQPCSKVRVLVRPVATEKLTRSADLTRVLEDVTGAPDMHLTCAHPSRRYRRTFGDYLAGLSDA